MPNYQAYPNSENTPNRKQRKSKRKTIFAYNAAQAGVERKARRDLRKQEKQNGSSAS